MYKLLIVDDNISDRKGLAELIDWSSMDINEIVLARNGREGLEKAIECEPSLVLTDISMPVMDGLSMAKSIIEELPDTKFIFMSCFDDTDYIRRAMKYNAYGYLLKPIDIEQLTDTVLKILKIKKDERELNETVTQLKNQVEENIPYIREMITRDFVYGNINGIYNEQIEAIGMETRGMYSVVVIQLKESENQDIETNCMAMYDIKNCLGDSYAADIRICSFLQSRTSMAAIVYLDGANNETGALEELLNTLGSFKNYVNNTLGYEVLICSGGVSNDLSEASELYANAEYTLKTNIYNMENNIILAEGQKCTDYVQEYDIFKIKEELTEMLSSESFDVLQAFLNKHYDKTVYNKNSLKAFTYTLVSLLQLMLLERNESFKNVFGDDAVIWNKLSEYNTILDIKQWMVNVFRFIYDYLNEKTETKGKYKQIVDKIKEIINEDYGNIESVNQISDKIYISASYANHLFKEHEGVSIFEYLVKVRMENAKEFLKNTDMKVYEISEKVGYKSKTYFGSLFREYTGMSPKIYRNKKGNVQ